MEELKVHYVPQELKDLYSQGFPHSQIKNGMVKSISDDKNHAFVVFNCSGDWKNFRNYTACLTSLKDLKWGWIKPDLTEMPF